MRGVARQIIVVAGLAALAVLMGTGTAAALTADPGEDQVVVENTLVTLDGRGSTPSDGGTITRYTWAQAPGGPRVVLSGANTAVATFRAPEVNPGGVTIRFDLTVTEDLGGQDTARVRVTVIDVVDQPPVLDPVGNKTIAEGQLLSFTVSASDPDGDPVTITATPLPAGAAFNGTTFSWTPTFTQAGIYQVTFTATAGGLTDSETITITVTNVNRAPVLATIPNQSVLEGQTVTVSLAASDPDGDGLRLSASGLPGFCALNDAGNGTGSIACSPGFGHAGSYSVTVTVTDDGTPPLADSKSFTLSVTSVNRHPVANAGPDRTVSEGALVTLDGTNSFDPDGAITSYLWA
ncbi:MAG: PKD domain-containing protein, partial [Deferrisomatales bacterium]|nr:PKD domain-containing protein [Deferrisomatales bacterium]